jgi:hypothetical protein
MEMSANKLEMLKKIKLWIYTNLTVFLLNGKSISDIHMNLISNAHILTTILSMVSASLLALMVKLLIARLIVEFINSKLHHALISKVNIPSQDVETSFSGRDLMVLTEKSMLPLPLHATALDFILDYFYINFHYFTQHY